MATTKRRSGAVIGCPGLMRLSAQPGSGRWPSLDPRRRPPYPRGVLRQNRRRACALATAAVLTAAVGGSVWGQDDHFPFGPFRMYSTTTPASGSVFIPIFVGTASDGEHLRITPSQVGLRRAEVLGRIKQIRRDPEFLRHYADAYERLHPGTSRVVELDLVYEIHHLEDGSPVTSEERTIVQWRRA
jgi:hypothetical protein